MLKNPKSWLLKLLIGLAIVVGVGWFVKCRCVDLRALTPGSIRNYIQSFGNFAVLVYILAYTLNTIAVFPPIAAISLVAGLAFGSRLGAIYLMIAAMLGTNIAFMIARFFGRGIAEKILKGKFRHLDEKFKENGFMAVLFVRIFPVVPYEIFNYLAGLSAIRFRDYFFATLLGLIPGVIISAFFGGSLGEIKTAKDLLAPKFIFASLLILLIIAIPLVIKNINKHSGDKR